MIKFADTHTRLVDAARCKGIADYENAKVERDFAQVKKDLARNAATMKAANKSLWTTWA